MADIIVENLVKDFSRRRRIDGRFAGIRSFLSGSEPVRAVDGVTFSVAPGEIVGYLGSNGAGKSTTIKMLTGILVPTSGRVEVAGITPWRDRRHNSRNIGVVFGQRTQLWSDLPLRDSLEAIRDLYGVRPAEYRSRMAEFDDLLGIGKFLDKPVRALSLGQRMRGDLVAAMLYRPPVLYLDEPTVGLDVMARTSLRDFIAESNRSFGTTVMLTTHDMDDVEELCRRIIVIDEGRVLYDGELSALKRKYVPYRDLVVTPSDPRDLERIETPHARRIGIAEGVVTLRFDPQTSPAPVTIRAVTDLFSIRDLSLVEPDLDDVVRLLYKDKV